MIYDDKTIDEVLEMDKLEYVENLNPLRADELKDPHRAIKIELLGIIAAYQEPVCCNRIFRDFEELNGEELDPAKYGFKSFSSMMRTFSDKFNCHVDFGKTMYSAKTTERSAHLQDLIRNQVTIEERRRRDMKRARSYSRPRRRNNNYGAGIFYAQNFVPLFTDERTEEERIADNLVSFGRSLAEVDSRGRGPNWGGMRSRGGDESSGEDENEEGMGLRSKSVPPSRGTELGAVFADPDASGTLEDCTNPFRSQNNERIRNIVIRHGEKDESGRKGLALTELAAKFKEEYKQPLGGVPNMREDRLLSKMRKVDTTEWIVEKMADDVAYVIVEADTLERVEALGPHASPMTPITPGKAASPEAPGSPCISPAGKRMLSFELKSAVTSNNRLNTRERNLHEQRAKSLSELTRYVADSDGDPVAVDSMEESEPEREETHEGPAVATYDRQAILALSDHDVLAEQVVKKVADMKLLRTQSPPSSGSSSHSSVASRRAVRPVGPPSRPTPPVNSFSMWSSQPSAKPSSGFASFGSAAGRATPTFGANKVAPPASDSDSDDDPVLQPTASSLAFKLPTFGKAAASASAFPSSPSGGSDAPRSLPSFGTSSQSVPATAPVAARALPTFGSTASSSSAGFPSAIGGSKISSPQHATNKNEQKGSEILGATIQLIGKLQTGALVYMREIEGNPVEEVVASNPDFLEIDENERIHLLHKNVDPKLLMFDGKALGELVEETKKVEAPAKASAAGAFSRPNMPTFGGARPVPTFGGPARPTNSEEKSSAFASVSREVPTFGGNRPVKVVEEVERPASAMSMRAEEPAKPRPEMPTLNGPKKPLIEVIEPPIVAAAPMNEPPKPLAGMPSFGTKSLEAQRPESALSNRSGDESRKVPTFGGAKVVSTSEQPRAESDSTLDSDDEGTQESKYTTAASGFSSRNGESMQSLSSGASMQSSQSTLEAEEKEVQEQAGPDSFPVHKDILSLCKKVNLAFDAVRKGEIQMAALLTSFDPNRIMLTLHEESMMEKLQLIMRELSSAYVDKTPLSVVQTGQFAVAINGEIVLRVVVLRQSVEGKDSFEVACLDFNAVLIVDKENLYELIDRFGVHAVRASTFVARVNLIPHLMSAGHSGVKMVVKKGEDTNDDSVKAFQPFVFHGMDERTGDMVVDVAIVMGVDVVWMGEAFPRFTGGPTQEGHLNPNIKSAIEYAAKQDMAGYGVSKEEKKNEEKTAPAEITSDQGLERASFAPVKQEQKEEGELDSSVDDSTTSERTTVDRHAAGVADFVRDVKEELPDDEFVVVAPLGTPIFHVESMVSLIRKLNAKGENVEVDVIKAMTRALVLTVNKTLSTLGDRGALIANAEALEEIDMA